MIPTYSISGASLTPFYDSDASCAKEHGRILVAQTVAVQPMAALTKDDLADLPTRACRYERHRPESTLLYQIIQEHWPRFQEHLAHQGKQLPAYVVQEFEAFMACGRLDRGFLRVQCQSCHAERLVAFSCRKRGFCRGRLVHHAAPDAWQIVPPTWSTGTPDRTFSPIDRLASGY